MSINFKKILLAGSALVAVSFVSVQAEAAALVQSLFPGVGS